MGANQGILWRLISANAFELRSAESGGVSEGIEKIGRIVDVRGEDDPDKIRIFYNAFFHKIFW